MAREYWRMSNGWGGAALNTEARQNETGAATLGGHYDSYGGARPPLWTGQAQRVAWADRDLVLERVKKLRAALADHARINRSTASALSGWLRSKGELVRRSRAIGIDIIDTGTVTPRDDVDPPPTHQQVSDAIGSVAAIDSGLRAFDQEVADKLSLLASTLNDDARNLEAVDRINRILTAQLDGVMEGASWDLDADYDFIMDQLSDLKVSGSYTWLLDIQRLREEELRFALESVGEAPEWLRHYLYDGVVPVPAEYVAFHAYNWALGGSMDKYLAVQQLMPGLLPEPSDEMRENFFRDGTAFHPTLDSTIEGSGGPANLQDLMQHMWDIYDRENYEGGRGMVEVIVVEDPNGIKPPKFIAVVPGTSVPMDSEEGWSGVPEGTDWPANVKAVGYGTSSATQSAMAAIDAAVAQYEKDHRVSLDRADVAIAGHSQGGIIAATIAQDRAFTTRHNVEHIFTAGSPIGHTNPGEGVSGLNIGNETDYTPALDLHSPKEWGPKVFGKTIPLAGPGFEATPRYQELLFEDARYGAPPDAGIEFGHQQETYHERIGQALAAEDPDITADERALQAFQEQMAEYLNGDAEHTTYKYKFGRN